VLEKNGVRIFQTKPEFQIILTQMNGERIDLAFPRTEGQYTDGRRPEHTDRTQSLIDDASRRDFTMNAMYIDKNANILDFFGGINDIKTKTIRAVGNPDERFKEDALRILRALRFSVVLGFGIEVDTYKAMRRNMHLLKQESIATDRIKDELNKAFKFNPYNTMILMRGLGLMEVLNDKDPKLKIEITNRS
jgi:tRNA nucleotidyltransferase (CCA-adding enzyme)